MRKKRVIVIMVIIFCVGLFSGCKKDVRQINVKNADFVLKKKPRDYYVESAEYHLEKGKLTIRVTINIADSKGRIKIYDNIENESRFRNLKTTLKKNFNVDVSTTQAKQTFSSESSDVTLTIHLYGESKGAFIFTNSGSYINDSFHWMDGKPSRVSGQPYTGEYQFTSSEVDEKIVYKEQLRAINNQFWFGDFFGRRVKVKNNWEKVE